MSDDRPDGVIVALDQANTALRHAVDVGRTRGAGRRSPQVWNDELHELRTLLATAALMIRGVDLTELIGHVTSTDDDLKPGQVLLEADSQLQAAQDDLNRAATALTTARQKIAVLR